MRSRVLVLVFLAAAACSVRTLNLGDGVVEVPDASPSPAVEAGTPDTGTLTFEERLRAICNQSAGPANRYTSARDLTARLESDWYLCDAEAPSPLGEAPGVRFGEDGTWTSLLFDATRGAFVPSSDPDEAGTFDYYAFADADAGVGPDGGGASRAIPLDDPTARGGIFIYLHRPISTDIVLAVDFEASPRRMHIQDVGPSTPGALYAGVP